MTYGETIEKIHSYHAFGKKPGLARITELMRILGNPQNSLAIIHVAGTNGKGSVCRYLYSVLEKAGYCCGLYTSPYIEKFTERFQFHGDQITEDQLTTIAARVFAAAEQMRSSGPEEPTEFDIITAIAFLYFFEKQADYVILEVGLGGRGDSTNVVQSPLVTAITSISLDHMAQLGDTVTQIAWEKAGICKPGVPMVFAVKDKEAAEVILKEAKAQSISAPVYDVFGMIVEPCASSPRQLQKKLGGYCFTSEIFGHTYDRIELGMTGIHQVENAMCALTILELLQRKECRRPAEISLPAIRAGMREACQPGRFELLPGIPPVILDGAHNPDGMRALSTALLEHFSGKRILLVLGILRDKAVEKMLRELVTLQETTQLTLAVTEPDNPRKMGAQELSCAVREALGADCLVWEDWREALRIAREKRSGYDAVIFAGSLYLIGNIRKEWGIDEKDTADL